MFVVDFFQFIPVRNILVAECYSEFEDFDSNWLFIYKSTYPSIRVILLPSLFPRFRVILLLLFERTYRSGPIFNRTYFDTSGIRVPFRSIKMKHLSLIPREVNFKSLDKRGCMDNRDFSQCR